MERESVTGRRSFLQATGAALGAGSIVAQQPNVAGRVHVAGDDTIRVALIGCGGRGTGAARDCLSVQDNIQLIAVADAFEDKARDALRRLKRGFPDRVNVPEERVFWGFDAYKKAIECDVDLVLLVTPPGFRPEHYRAAIEAGKHVFMEKPCCVDAPGYRSLLETNKLADEKKLKVVVGLNTRHTAWAKETVQRIRDGAIGKVLFLRAYGNNAGVWVRPRKPGETEMQHQMRNWYYFVWLSGDLNVEQHVHMLDIANWVMDGQHPTEANGMGGRQVRKGKDYGHIYDHHFVEYTYADGTRLYSQCRHIKGCWPAGGVYVHGDQGWADCHGTIRGKQQWDYKGPRESGHRQEHVDLIKAIRENLPCNEGWYGATSSFTAVLGRMATYSGLVVHWDEAVARGPSEMPKRLAWDADPPVLPDANGSYEHAVAMPGVYRPY